jgi:hypothetical protein
VLTHHLPIHLFQHCLDDSIKLQRRDGWSGLFASDSIENRGADGSGGPKGCFPEGVFEGGCWMFETMTARWGGVGGRRKSEDSGHDGIGLKRWFLRSAW